MTAASAPSTPPTSHGPSAKRLPMTPKASRQPRSSRKSVENAGSQPEAQPKIQPDAVAQPVTEPTQQIPKTPEQRVSVDDYMRHIRAPEGPRRWTPFQVYIGLEERQDVEANHNLQRRRRLLKNRLDEKRKERLAQFKARLAAARNDKEAEEIVTENYL